MVFTCNLVKTLLLILYLKALSLIHCTGSNGSYRRTGIPTGDFTLRVIAYDPVRGDKAVIRNRLWVHSTDPNDLFCIMYLKNRGWGVSGTTFSVDFTGTGAASASNNGQFECSVDRQQPQPCKREWEYSDPLYGNNKYDSNLCSKERSLRETIAALHYSVFIFQSVSPVLSRYKSSGSDRPHSWDQVPREGPTYWLWSRLQSLE